MNTEALYIAKKNVRQRTVRQAVLESKPLGAMARLFSAILGEKVSPLRALKLTNAQAAIASLITFGGMSPLVSLVLLAWVAAAIYQCKE